MNIHLHEIETAFELKTALGFVQYANESQHVQDSPSVLVPSFDLCGSLLALPWIRWRFSLRTLLIGMTVVAVALGLIFAPR